MAAQDLTEQLVDGVKERNEEAFSTLHQLLASDLLSFAYGMLRDRGAAEDAVQQAFLELARAAPTIRGNGRSLRAWLYRSVRYSCLDELRRRQRHPEIPSEHLPDPGVGDDLPDPTLAQALLELPDRQRAVIVLRYVTGCEVSEIASILNTSRAAIYATSARAERRLKRLLASVEDGPPPASSPMSTTDRTSAHDE